MQMLEQTVSRNLPCRLSLEEWNDRAKQLAEAVQNVATEERRQTDVKAGLKARLAELQSKQSVLADVVQRREESRDLVCDQLAYVERGIVEIVRRDTGEVIETRPLQDHERQQALKFEKEETRHKGK